MKTSKEKRPGLQNVVFYQGNAPIHKGDLEMRQLRDLKHKLLEHPPYLPDLAHFNLQTFP